MEMYVRNEVRIFPGWYAGDRGATEYTSRSNKYEVGGLQKNGFLDLDMFGCGLNKGTV